MIATETHNIEVVDETELRVNLSAAKEIKVAYLKMPKMLLEIEGWKRKKRIMRVVVRRLAALEGLEA